MITSMNVPFSPLYFNRTSVLQLSTMKTKSKRKNSKNNKNYFQKENNNLIKLRTNCTTICVKFQELTMRMKKAVGKTVILYYSNLLQNRKITFCAGKIFFIQTLSFALQYIVYL